MCSDNICHEHHSWILIFIDRQTNYLKEWIYIKDICACFQIPIDLEPSWNEWRCLTNIHQVPFGELFADQGIKSDSSTENKRGKAGSASLFGGADSLMSTQRSHFCRDDILSQCLKEEEKCVERSTGRGSWYSLRIVWEY